MEVFIYFFFFPLSHLMIEMDLNKIYKMFPTRERCVKHLERIIWNNKPICPHCNSNRQTAILNENRYHCNNCTMSYSVTVGTIFHRSKCDLQKWFAAIYYVLRVNKHVTARQLAIEIKVTKDTALSISDKIRKVFIKDAEFLNRIIDEISNKK